MRVLLFDHPQTVTREELSADLLLLPEWRRQKALRYRFLIDRVLCVKAYLLLCQGLSEEYGICEPPTFTYLDHAKPILPQHPDIHFNLSHCRSGVLCLLAPHPVGCDVEEIPPVLDLDLCHYCFSASEIQDILSAPSPVIRFTVWWTRKEAYLKFTGTGLVDDLPGLFTPDVLSRIIFETTECPEQGFVYTVCWGRG